MAKEPDEVLELEKGVSLQDLIALVPQKNLRIRLDGLFEKYDSWKDIQDMGARMFFERQEFLYRLATTIPTNKENRIYINFIAQLIRNSADMFKLWLETDAVPQLTKAVEELQADLDVLLKLIQKHLEKPQAEEILEEFRLERHKR